VGTRANLPLTRRFSGVSMSTLPSTLGANQRGNDQNINICWAAVMISCCDFLLRQLMMSFPVSVVHSSLVASSLLAS